ncbi:MULTISPECIES: hypothetical protein [Shinella]|uniref:hypothetical protein n=1 Tax=Shinella TaxID=323620 RepID=UPI001F56530A|nr:MULTISPECIES: hypothetical protein [Shinella]MCW5710597.1 hypothetical protein [Shinella sp.]
MKTAAYIANTEVLCCASTLIATLAEASPETSLTKAARSLHGDGEPDGPEVMEHWIVSGWLAEKLIESDEIVDTDFAGLSVWGRRTAGQPIESDDVIVAIAKKTRA